MFHDPIDKVLARLDQVGHNQQVRSHDRGGPRGTCTVEGCGRPRNRCPGHGTSRKTRKDYVGGVQALRNGKPLSPAKTRKFLRIRQDDD